MNLIQESLALLGQSMKDRVTGFKGMVSSVSFDAYGCVQVILSPPVGKDGKPGEGFWFDVKRLVKDGKRVMDAPNFGVNFGTEQGPAAKPARQDQPLR